MKECEEEEKEVLIPLVKVLKNQEYCEWISKNDAEEAYLVLYEHDGLCYGLTVMQPVCVNGECNVTRGHFHEDLDCDEIYCGMGGEGLLLLMDEDYHCHAEKVYCGSVHYIDGHLAHRLVNTGNSELKVQCMWPSNAGHDYKRVEDHPFTVRVYKENGELKVEEE